MQILLIIYQYHLSHLRSIISQLWFENTLFILSKDKVYKDIEAEI